MTLHLTGTREPFTLRFEQRTELAARCARAVRRARRQGEEVLVGLSVELDPAVDPSAVVFASRAAGEDWFAYEQPARGGAAVAALGALRRLEAEGPGRFADVAEAWRRLAGAAVAGDDPRPAGPRPVAGGGLAVAPARGAAPPRARLRGRAPARPPRGAPPRRGRAGGRARCPPRRPRGRAARGGGACPPPRPPHPTTCPSSSPTGWPRASRACAPMSSRCSTPRPPGASASPASR